MRIADIDTAMIPRASNAHAIHAGRTGSVSDFTAISMKHVAYVR